MTFSVLIPEDLGVRSRDCQPSVFLAFSTADESGWRVGSGPRRHFQVFHSIQRGSSLAISTSATWNMTGFSAVLFPGIGKKLASPFFPGL
jgi:hypothetical protein